MRRLGEQLNYALGAAIGFGGSASIAPPANTALPAISGTANVGYTLTASTGTWTGAPTSYAYQWKRGGVDIGGATSSTYTTTKADEGASITVTVTATNTGGSTSATSAGTIIFIPSSISGGVFDFDPSLLALADGAEITTYTDPAAGVIMTRNTTGPLYKTNSINGQPVARFSASNKSLRNTSFARTQPSTHFVVGVNGGNTQVFVSGAGGGYTQTYVNSGGNYEMYVSANAIGLAAAAQWHIYESQFNGASSAGYKDATPNAEITANPGTAAMSQLWLGNTDANNGQLAGDIARVLIYNKILSASERQQVLTYLAGLYGFAAAAATGYSVANLIDNRQVAADAYGVVYQSNPLARAQWTTTATSMTIKIWSSLTKYNTSYPSITIFRNGVALATKTCTGNGLFSFTQALAGGSQTIEIVVGPQSRSNYGSSNPVLGTWLWDVSFNASATPTAPDAPASRVVVYGDSIAIGWGATTPTTQAWTQLLRANIRVAVEGFGFRQLYDDGADAAGRTALAANLASYTPSIIWLAIGTNDYANNPWGGAANFGTAYADLLDKIHAAAPSAAIYAQSPILRNPDGTLSTWRTQISNACSGRAWATYVDGVPLVSVGNLADAVHPNTTGHSEYYTNVKAILGL